MMIVDLLKKMRTISITIFKNGIIFSHNVITATESKLLREINNVIYHYIHELREGFFIGKDGNVVVNFVN